MTRRLLAAFTGLLFLLGSPAAAHQGERRAGLDWLIGSWNGGGTHSGRQSAASLEARLVLGGKFVELRYRLQVRGPQPFTFEGRAFYRPAEGNIWKADWFDSRGLVLPVSAALEGTSLTADWGGVGTEQGRTIYRLLADGRLEIVDSVLGLDGTRREFARQTFRKAR